MKSWKSHQLFGQGNINVTPNQPGVGDAHHVVFDISRLQDGPIVKHRAVTEKILPPEVWKNVAKF